MQIYTVKEASRKVKIGVESLKREHWKRDSSKLPVLLLVNGA